MLHPSVNLGGTEIHLLAFEEAVGAVVDRPHLAGAPPLAVASANLDHVHHFGRGGRWHGVLEASARSGDLEWLTLLDGQPLVTQVLRRTGQRWPKLAGSDLTRPIIATAEERGVSVGFLGGSPETHEALVERLGEEHPLLRVAGCWAPGRSDLLDPERSARLAEEIRASETEILFVGLGKPRQEVWIAEHGARTGAGALLAFGASADFLAGRVTRAPGWVSDSGMEWGWRLAQEPRRLSRRYLVDGPPAYWRIRQSVPVAGVPDLDGWQVVGPATGPASRNAPRGTKAGAEGTPRGAHGSTPSQRTADRPTFVPSGEDADVVAIVVTHNNVAEIGALLHDLREEARDLRLRVVVVDNDSTDGTLDLVSTVPGVVTVASGANRGYAGGVNVGTAFAGSSRALLVLNADIRVRRHTVRALWRRLWQPGVGAVVPRLLAVDGETFPSLRFEPSLLRTVGDALLGERLPGRPTWASEVDLAEESYRFAHPIHWATGAALLVRAAVAEQVGAWDEEFFLYSEETDYQRRIRDAGWEVWFDPAGRVVHAGQASGHSPELAALLAVNRVRYVGRYHRRAYERAVQAAAATGAALRWGRGEEARCALRYLLDRRTWDRLPAAPLNGAPADLRSVDAPRQPERRARHGARP